MGNCVICEGREYIMTDDGACECSCKHSKDIRRLLKSAGIGPEHAACRLDNYNASGKSQMRAKEAVARWLAAFSTPETGEHVGGLLIHGVPGTGKTHLLIAAFSEACKMAPSGRINDMPFAVLWDAQEFVEMLKRGIGKNSDSEFEADQRFEDACYTPVLFFDDLGAERSTEFVADRLSLLFDRRYRNQLPTIITTNLDPHGESSGLVAAVGPRIRSRILGSSECVLIEGKDHRQNKPGGKR